VRTNSASGGLVEGACDVAVVRVGPAAGDDRFDGAVVGLEARCCALAADDPLARRRQLRLADLAGRVLAVDPRTGTTTPELWPAGDRPEVEEIHDVDDWLAVIAAGRCVGVTAEGTLAQYRRPGVVFRRLRDAPPVPVRVIWWRDDPHPAAHDVVGLLAELYRGGSAPRRR
jgi:DNA-binding transcriptional LysR family regulator